MRDSDYNIKPIDAFVEYVEEVKPYHTKLLEIVERYHFTDDISVNISENLFKGIKYQNTPLCRPVGWGLVYDSCGYSSDSCCDLFQCIGGYGLIFDNSDLLGQHTIIGIDKSADVVSVPGNWIYDRRIEILSIQGNMAILKGNRTADFINHNLFLIAPFNVHSIVNYTQDSIILEGNRVTEFNLKKEFRVVGTRGLDGEYGVASVTYDEVNHVTKIKVAGNHNFQPISINGGYVETEASPQNQGAYIVDTVLFDGTNTIVRIKNGSFPVNTNKNTGSVQLRTALLAPRHVWLKDGATGEMLEFRIADSFYNVLADQTYIVVAEMLDNVEMTFNPTEVRLHGYMTTAGYDNDEECDRPKEENIHTTFGEKLVIRIIDRPNT